MSYLLNNPNYDVNFANLKLEDNLIVENVQCNNNLQVDEDTLLNNLEVTGVCVLPSITIDDITAKTLELKLNSQPNVVNNQNNERIVLQNTPLNLNCSIEAGEILLDNNTPVKNTRIEYNKISVSDASISTQINIDPSQGVEVLNYSTPSVSSLLNSNGLSLTDNVINKTASINAGTLTIEEIILGTTSTNMTLPTSRPVLSNSFLTCDENTGLCSWNNQPIPISSGQTTLNLTDDTSNIVNTLIVDYQVINNIVNLRLSLGTSSFNLSSNTNYLYSDALPSPIAPTLISNDSMQIGEAYFYWNGSNHSKISIFIQEISASYRIYIYPQVQQSLYSNSLTYFSSGNCSIQTVHNLKPPTGGTQLLNFNYINCLPYFIN